MNGAPAAYGPIQGEHGQAVPVVVPPVPDMANILMHWLITARGFSATRTQWMLAACTLADLPGLRPVTVRVYGATHEVIVIPLDPAGGPQNPHSVVRLLLAKALPTVQADAVMVQTRTSPPELAELMPILAAAIVRQGWSPDVVGDPGNVRGAWREGIESNLRDIRQRMAQPQQPQGIIVPQPPLPPPNGARTATAPITSLLAPPERMTPPGGNSKP
jgi:hypothetical protein